ncbi:restriction endonuclease subunit S [uncultured Fibrella sp.]|uniref:restriction endonuclease subunit S n=1 Tax=uncultured Fibrella sp. TaxID=1284596 RepID=UPI0035CBF898
MKDLKENVFSVDEVEGFTDLTRLDERHFLQPSDVLLLTKGQRTLAIRVAATYPKVIASAAFLVIRPDTSQLDGGYLHWYLNQPEAQTWFEMGRERSATVMAVPLSVVQSLPVPLPPLEQQRSIGVLGRLTAREHYLSVQIARKRQALRNKKLNHFIDQATNTNQPL